jgi:hypothetical protein
MRWLLIIGLLAAGCVPMPVVTRYVEGNYYEPGVVLEAPVGGVLVLIADGAKVNGIPSSRFERSLIYSGRAGSIIRLMYRETSNDWARPAFGQELQYDLDKSDVIAFQNVRLKVVSATNLSVVVDQLPPVNSPGPQLSSRDLRTRSGPSQPKGKGLGEACDRDDECAPNVCSLGKCRR